MGLGIGFVLARTGLSSVLRSALSPRDVAHGLHDFLRGDPVFGKVASLTEKSSSEFGISVLPIAEDVEIFQNGSHLVLAGQTSAAGPGYHAYLVGKIKEFSRLRKISIEENDEWQDETGYFSDNDFGKLQAEMRAHLEALTRIVVEKSLNNAAVASIALSMPRDSMPVGFDGSVLTQRGPHDGSLFAVPVEPAAYFPWWLRGINPESAWSLAEALLWTTFPWRQSVDEREGAIEQLLSNLLEIARSSSALQANPNLITNFEIARLSVVVPDAKGVGYLRHSFRRQVAGSWSVQVPGYFLKEYDPSDGVWRFWIGKRDIQVSTYRTDQRVDPFEGEETAIVGEADGMLFKANIESFDTEHWQGNRLWGAAIGDGGFAKITVIYGDSNDEGWARETLFSLKYDGTSAP